MLLRELSEAEAENLPTDDENKFILLGKTYEAKTKTLWYKRLSSNEWYAIWLTNDTSCWVIGGAVYNSQSDVPPTIK